MGIDASKSVMFPSIRVNYLLDHLISEQNVCMLWHKPGVLRPKQTHQYPRAASIDNAHWGGSQRYTTNTPWELIRLGRWIIPTVYWNLYSCPWNFSLNSPNVIWVWAHPRDYRDKRCLSQSKPMNWGQSLAPCETQLCQIGVTMYALPSAQVGCADSMR